MWGKPRTELVEAAVHGLQLIWSINWTDIVLQQTCEKGVATYLASISLPHILCGAPFSCITYLLPPNNPKHHIGINTNREYLWSTISLEPQCGSTILSQGPDGPPSVPAGPFSNGPTQLLLSSSLKLFASPQIHYSEDKLVFFFTKIKVFISPLWYTCTKKI